MKGKTKFITGICLLLLGAFASQLFIFKKWLLNKYEPKRWLIIVVTENSPKLINIYNNCYTGDDLLFKAGIASVYAKNSTIQLVDNLSGVSIRIIDSASVFRNKNYLQSNTKMLYKVESIDSTSSCGVYKKIYLR